MSPTAAPAEAFRLPRKLRLIGAYLLLLAASWLWQSVREPADTGPRLVAERASGTGAPVVLVPRLPDARADSELCRSMLAATSAPVWRVEWPRSSFGRPREDYSTHALVAELAGLVGDQPALANRAHHWVGEGMGGVVVAELAARHPGMVRSVALVNSPGSQEYTLLGNAVANKFVYFFHHIPYFLADRLLPHFGGLHEVSANRAFSAVFFDSDLSETRSHLRTWQGPLLVVHGEANWVTPVDAARYTARLAPQARVAELPGGRNLADLPAAARDLAGFQAEADAGRAPVRETPAPPGASWPELVTSMGSRFWILMTVIAVCTFVAEDPTCLACGLLAAEGIIGFWWAALACTVGIFVGDMVLYLAGYTLGRRALSVPPLRWMVQAHEIDRMSAWFSSPRGLMVIVSSRFIPASRVPTFVTAGILRLSLPRLGFLLLVAALVWTPVLMWLGHTFGPPFMEQFPKYKQHAAWIILGVLLGIWLFTHWVLPLLTHRGRREVLMRVTRLLRTDLWPTAIRLLPLRAALYLPAVLRGRVTAPSAANPGFGRLGGAVGDAKGDLLEPFAEDARTCPFVRLEAGSPGLGPALAFAARHGYPLALKPELGAGGAGLLRLEDEAALRAALGETALTEGWLLQPWLHGREFEVVWRRDPGASVGELVAVVEKCAVEVVGDGRRSLEALIWDDPFAVARADLYQRIHYRSLLRVPAAGEAVRLDVSGSWEHGARPRRRAHLETAALRAALDAYCRNYPGLHHARLDLRAGSETDLAEGRFQVTEVEGAGSVSSLVRDRHAPLRESVPLTWRQLRAQFAAGHANLDHGLRKVAWAELLARRATVTGRADGYRIAG
jgi:membrane protein DedA with SNARE-associated domain/pimeloyl-ACP methyl ester carboxylesterase